MRFSVPLSDAEQKLLLRAEALLTRCHNRISEATTLSDPSTAGKLFQMRLGAHDREIWRRKTDRRDILDLDDGHSSALSRFDLDYLDK